MLATVYKRPDGRAQEIDVTEISAEDAAWFIENKIAVSFEDCGNDTAVYADCGFCVDDEEDESPDEIILFAGSRTCEQAMADLRAKCECAFSTGRTRFEPEGAVAQ